MTDTILIFIITFDRCLIVDTTFLQRCQGICTTRGRLPFYLSRSDRRAADRLRLIYSYPLFDQPTCIPCLSIYQQINQLINQAFNQLIIQSVYCIYLFIYIYLPISIYPFIYIYLSTPIYLSIYLSNQSICCDITARTIILYVLFCLTYMYCTLYH